MIKTRIDEYISRFMEELLELAEVPFEKVAVLLDDVRRCLEMDMVFIVEKEDDKKSFVFKHTSVSKPEYNATGLVVECNDEEFDAVMHMYDESPVSEMIVNSARESGMSDSTLHYGFHSKRSGIYNGSIGFQLFRPHKWTEEEKAALTKLGRLYQLITGISFSDSIFSYLYDKLELERKQYRSALTEGSEYNFTVDITDGYIREKIYLADGSDMLDGLGLSIPVSYDEANIAFLKNTGAVIEDQDMLTAFSCAGLLNLYRNGNTHPDVEYYNPRLDTYIRVTVFMYEDKLTGHIWGLFVAANVTEAKKRQEIQRQALQDAYDAAKQANAAKSQFLSNMSHDIRTPMNAIIGMTAIAGTHLDDRERVADCLTKITTSSKHLLGLINEILDMSKIESGNVELAAEDFNLSDLVDNLLTMVRPQVDAHQHTLTVAIQDVEHEQVIGDSQRIQQVFMNIMSNAVKYTPDGGRIELTIREKPTKHNLVGCYEFVFKDNGIGMSEDFLPYIFEAFARAKSADVEKMQGTGLGMAIANNIVHMMNGDIKVESELGKGSTFTVTIYLELQNVSEAKNIEQLVGLPVLVVDDDKLSCETVCSILNDLGMKGEWVTDARKAVERVANRHEADDDFFAVIIDWKMPKMDGIAATKAIRKRVGRDIPIIIISAYDWSAIETKARAAGANAFLSKPVFKSRVAHLFKSILGNDTASADHFSLNDFSVKDFSGKRVLLVEDNEINAEIAGEILGMTGITVEYAVNGKEAVDRMMEAADDYYDMIFMDIQMPTMNGYEATRAIRALDSPYAKKVPILAMTANAFAEDVQASKSAGMNEHIAKPLDFKELLKVMNRWLV